MLARIKSPIRSGPYRHYTTSLSPVIFMWKCTSILALISMIMARFHKDTSKGIYTSLRAMMLSNNVDSDLIGIMN